MKMLTIRIYFEHGAKATGLTVWQRFWVNTLAHQLMKKGKEQNLKQVLLFNVTSGYLNSQSIQLGVSEYRSPKHPQCLEVTDHKDKIDHFLTSIKSHLEERSVIVVESQSIEVIKSFNS